MKKNTRLALLAALVLAVGMGAVYLRFGPQATAGEKHITVSVAYPDGNREEYEVTTEAEFLREAAQTVLTLEGEESAYGFTVYSINGVEADFTTESAYWAVYVNGDYGQYSVDAQPVADGDAFLFAYETY